MHTQMLPSLFKFNETLARLPHLTQARQAIPGPAAAGSIGRNFSVLLLNFARR